MGIAWSLFTTSLVGKSCIYARVTAVNLWFCQFPIIILSTPAESLQPESIQDTDECCATIWVSFSQVETWNVYWVTETKVCTQICLLPQMITFFSWRINDPQTWALFPLSIHHEVHVVAYDYLMRKVMKLRKVIFFHFPFTDTNRMFWRS